MLSGARVIYLPSNGNFPRSVWIIVTVATGHARVRTTAPHPGYYGVVIVNNILLRRPHLS
jgi:hypothetical protein